MEYFQFIKKGEEITIKIEAGEDFYLALANLDIPKIDKVQILKLRVALDLLLEKPKS
jgi:hypothetical protein